MGDGFSPGMTRYGSVIARVTLGGWLVVWAGGCGRGLVESKVFNYQHCNAD